MIGRHTVGVVPDPTVVPWSAPLNSNPDMTTDLAGWVFLPFQPANTFVWAAPGVAQYVTGNPTIRRSSEAPYTIARNPTVTTYRVTVKGHVKMPNGPAWVIPGLTYGVTAIAAAGGAFWSPGQAIDHGWWFPVDESGEMDFEFVLNSDARQVPPGFAFLGPSITVFSPNEQPGFALTVDSIVLQAQTFDFTDISCLVDQVSIQHGRQGATGQPDASAVTLDLSYDSDEASLPDGFDVGSLVQVTTTVDGVDSVRFSGNVSDMATGWDDAGTETPSAVVAQVVAVGALADSGRRVIGDEPWPQELDGARVARIMNLAGFNLDSITSDPGTVQILPRDVDKQPALALAQEVADSANGILWQTRTGAIRYADAEHRRRTAATLSLDACDVLVTPTWRRDLAGLVNSISLGYGVPVEEGGEQPRYTATREDSQQRYGRFEFTTATVLSALADAEAMANLLLTRNSHPVWILSELPVDVYDLDAARTLELLALDMHDLLSITGLPTTGDLPVTTSLWVEGWSEVLADGVHELSLYVSGYCRTSPPPRWDDVPEEWTWDTLPNPDATWDDASCFGPPTTRGRWADVPASLRWDWVPLDVTWDTWPY